MTRRERVAPLDRFNQLQEIIQAFGGKAQYQMAVRELERTLYC